MNESARGQAGGPWQRHRAALRLGGCLAVGVGLVAAPSNLAQPARAGPVVVLELARIPEAVAPRAPTPAAAPLPIPVALPAASVPNSPAPLVVAATDPPVPLVSPPPPASLPSPPRAVDVAQISEAAGRALHVPQLHEPGLAAGGGLLLAAKIDAMQVTLPAPPRLSDRERATLLAEAPAEMTVRVGDEAVGAVAFRMSDARTIDVQLSGLLDIVADRMTPEDYGRLRTSDAAGEFVPLDALRAIGISVRYDAVYDELDLSA